MKLKNILKSLPLILLLIALDQASKSYLILYLKTQFGYSIEVTSWFKLVYAWNHGISFGLFSEYAQYSNYAFLAINCLIVGYLTALLSSSTDKKQNYGIILIIGGALGNLVDRLYRGAVFDFLYFHYEKYSFPAFNLADVFINIGVILIIIALFLSKKRSL